MKECATSIALIFVDIFRRSLKTGDIPTDWHDANIFQMFKKGKSDNPVNYCLIYLTSIASKLLEHKQLLSTNHGSSVQ